MIADKIIYKKLRLQRGLLSNVKIQQKILKYSVLKA